MSPKKKGVRDRAPSAPPPADSAPGAPLPDNPQLRHEVEEAARQQTGLSDAEMARRRVKALEDSRKLPPDPASESKNSGAISDGA